MRPTRKRSTPPTPTRSLRTGSRSHTTERSGGGSGKRPKGARGATHSSFSSPSPAVAPGRATPWTPPLGGARWETGNWPTSACRPPGPFSLPARRDNRMTPPVDLRSDTVTLPSPGMRKAMARAQGGDSQRGEESSVRAADVAQGIAGAPRRSGGQVRLVAAENTHNAGGGTVFSITSLRRIRGVCRKAGIPFHIDGSRIFNASVASGVPPADYGKVCHSLMFCLSKGLGAPVGSVVVGSREFIGEARSVGLRVGGGMRQAGDVRNGGSFPH